MECPSINVVYLCWLPYGLNCFNSFIDSYKKFDAGISHKLVIVFKGNDVPYKTEPFTQILRQQNIPFQQLIYTGKELDVTTYYWAAQQLHCESILFLNTRSRILAQNWLSHFYTVSEANPKTVFSATGSWQSYVSAVFKKNKLAYESTKSFTENVNKYKLLMKAATLWWCYFPLFPNPHIRTNAFFINRQLFLSLKIKMIVTKINAYRFESGRNSFTNQLKRKGYSVALLAKGGEKYFEKDWHHSKIFWTADQHNLMIADNQTEAYTNSDISNRQLLEKLAWG